MIIRVADLQDEGLTVESVAEVGRAYSDPAWRLDGVRLLLAPDGADVCVTGELHATVPLTCGRCLETFRAPVQVPVDVRLVPRPTAGDNVELGAEDLDVDFYDGTAVDLGALIEAETTLVLPMKPLCRADCRGLCPTCGANRNTVACACAERAPDPRLAVLRDLAARLNH